MSDAEEPDEILRPRQVAAILGISPRTLSDWARAGLLPYRETPGGHRRYPKAAVLALVARLDRPAVAPPPPRVVGTDPESTSGGAQ